MVPWHCQNLHAHLLMKEGKCSLCGLSLIFGFGCSSLIPILMAASLGLNTYFIFLFIAFLSNSSTFWKVLNSQLSVISSPVLQMLCI